MSTDADQEQPVKKTFVALVGIHPPPLSHRVRRDTGHYLDLIQAGTRLGMPISQPMPSIGPGVHELRLSDRSGDWRIVYRVDDNEVVVVDVFAKTTRATPPHLIDRCQARLAAYDAL